MDREQSLQALLGVDAPAEPVGYAEFWQARYARCIAIDPRPRLLDTQATVAGRRVFDLTYTSTDGVTIGGWLTLPTDRPIRRGFVVGHGYGGRDAPDFHLPFDDAALAFPCARGLGRSPHPHIASDPQRHVLHGIDDPDRYVLGGCVDDLWLAVSALERVVPETRGNIGYLGISFGGGVGTMAAAWDVRIARMHVQVASFGHHPLRLSTSSVGSAMAVQDFVRRHPGLADRTLALHDASIAARHVTIPVHCACALIDPAVAPAGQFAIYNALAGPKALFVLQAGHQAYPQQAEEEQRLLSELAWFFAPLA